MKIEGIDFYKDSERSGWLIGNTTSVDGYELSDKCLELNRHGSASNHFAVCGAFGYEDEYKIYLIPKETGASELIKIFVTAQPYFVAKISCDRIGRKHRDRIQWQNVDTKEREAYRLLYKDVSSQHGCLQSIQNVD